MNKRLVALSALSVIALASCGGAADVVEKGVGYGLVHGHYVGIVEITTTNDVVTEIEIDEYFLPYNWGKVTVTEVTEDTVQVTTSRGVSTYAEFVKIGDKTFTATVVGDAPAQSIKYSSTGIADLDAWVAVEANAKWYVEQIEANLYGYLLENGQAATFTKGDASSTTSMRKSTSGYWATGALGWAGNIAEVKELLLDSEMDFVLENFVKNGEGYWANGDVVTGVTMTDFKDYVSVALRAYANRAEIE